MNISMRAYCIEYCTTDYCTVITNPFLFPVIHPKSDILSSLCYVLVVIKDKSADDKRTYSNSYKKINDDGPCEWWCYWNIESVQ